MRAVAQRVSQASVAVDGQVVGAIGEPGLLVLVGVTHDDTPEKAAKLAAKLWGLRVLDGDAKRAIVDAEQDIAAPHALVIAHIELDHASRHVGTDGGLRGLHR